MRLSVNPLVEIPVTWYFVPDDTPFIPNPNAFGTQRHNPIHFDFPAQVGEVIGSYGYWNGSVPPGVITGPYKGDDTEWLNGCSHVDMIALWSGGQGQGGSWSVGTTTAPTWSGGQGQGGSWSVGTTTSPTWSGGQGQGGSWSGVYTAGAYAGAATNLSTIGTVLWNAPIDAKGAPDGVFSTATLTTLSEKTEYLALTSYGFTVPTGASIQGVTVIATEKASGTAAVVDASVRLLVGSAVAGTDKASAVVWSSSSFTQTYGSSSDLWGISLTPAQVSATGFGIAIAALNPVVTPHVPGVDAVQIIVTWSL